MKVNSKLFENILSLTVIKGLEYILAFITFPYLVRVLQVEQYGLIVFAQSIIQYFVLLTDYGFNLLGPREIAQHDSVKERGSVFSNIFFSKLLLLFGSTVIYGFGMLGLAYYHKVDIVLYLIFYLMVIGNVLFPVWFFQGIQQMRYITFVNIIANVFRVAGIFMLVKTPQDYLLAALFQAIVPLVAAVFSWVILVKDYPEVLVLPNRQGIKKMFVDGWSVFTSTIAINLYTASNVVVLGMMTNNTVVGYFSGAKKIIDNVTLLISPITQAIYPYVSKKASISKTDALSFLHKIIIALGGGNLLLSLFIMVFAEWIVKLLLGSGYEQSVLLLRIMAFLPVIISLSNIFGVQTMLVFGMQKEFSRILMMAAVLNTCVVLPMIYLYEGIGVSVTITVTECFVTVMMWYVLKCKGINLLKVGQHI